MIQASYASPFSKEKVMTTCVKNDDAIPEYGQSPAKPGLYLGLFHGRDDPNQKMDGWGFNGPTIGPLVWCHTTYANDVKIEFESECDAKRYFRDHLTQQDFGIKGDMLIYAGKYYGDWTVYYVPPSECLPPEDTFRASKRAGYRIAHNPMPK
ncbi:MAG: hypothetical protein EAZ11_02620 [Curvibacter sp.]|nr:MAG: hypothetical protein EAZ11_02620 [Curvibacter sp.]